MIIQFVRNEGFFDAPVFFLNNVADPLAGFEIPALTIFAEEIKFYVRKLKVNLMHIFTHSLSLLNFKQYKFAQLACLDSCLGLYMLHLKGVVRKLLSFVW